MCIKKIILFSYLDKYKNYWFYVFLAKSVRSETPEKVLKLKDGMEVFAHLQVTNFINNTNLLTYAGDNDLRIGQEVIHEASMLSDIPAVFITECREFLKNFFSDHRDPAFSNRLSLEAYIQRSCQAFTTSGL